MRNLGVHGVDTDRYPLLGKLFDDGKHPCHLDLGGDPGGAGAGRLAADVDDGRALGDQLDTVLDSAIAVQEQSTVGERVVGDVDDTHHLHARISPVASLAPRTSPVASLAPV